MKFPVHDRSKDGNIFDWILKEVRVLRAKQEAERILKKASRKK